jgi:hypothetical protein
VLRTVADTRPTGAWLAIGGAAVLVAFGAGLAAGGGAAPSSEPLASQAPPAPEPPATTGQAPEPPRAVETPPAKVEEGSQQPSAAKPGKFSAKAARSAVDRVAARARGCKVAGEPTGSVSTTITFEPSGKVSDVTVTTPRFVGTKVARCVVSRLNDARVPEFSGGPVTVKKSFTVR